tara:strand:- start:166 stop:558 length:393 start_codon:yes stop_codon:yes gene_type:complete
VQVSLNGLQGSYSLPEEFPYEAMNPMTTKKQTFESLDDVYEVLEECYDKCTEKGFNKLGEALYQQSLFIVNDYLLIDKKMQDTIKQYRFCKKFNAPPYPSLQNTPERVIESFMIIDDEIEIFNAKANNGK